MDLSSKKSITLLEIGHYGFCLELQKTHPVEVTVMKQGSSLYGMLKEVLNLKK